MGVSGLRDPYARRLEIPVLTDEERIEIALACDWHWETWSDLPDGHGVWRDAGGKSYFGPGLYGAVGLPDFEYDSVRWSGMLVWLLAKGMSACLSAMSSTLRVGYEDEVGAFDDDRPFGEADTLGVATCRAFLAEIRHARS